MTFFTTKNPDMILRAGQQPDSTHDFHVHKTILCLASPVLPAMFDFPQPPHQAPIEQSDTPIIEVPDSPETMDAFLRFIYPGTEDPKITDLPTLAAVFLVVERYKTAHLWPVLERSLETFLPRDPSAVHTVACRFGLTNVAEEADKVLNPQNYGSLDYAEEQRIASKDLSVFGSSVQPGEYVGRSSIWGFPLRGIGPKHLDGKGVVPASLKQSVFGST